MSYLHYQHNLLYERSYLVEPIRQYILAVITISILSGIAQLLFSGSQHMAVVKLVTGLMVTITVMNPILRKPELSFGVYLEKINVDGQWAVTEGENAAMCVTSELIKERTQTYICDKAAEMGASIAADVKLGDGIPPVPSEIILKGNVSPYVRRQIMGFLQEDLGLTEDKLLWIS